MSYCFGQDCIRGSNWFRQGDKHKLHWRTSLNPRPHAFLRTDTSKEDEEDGREDGEDGQSDVSDRRWLAPIFTGNFSNFTWWCFPHEMIEMDVVAVRGIGETERSVSEMYVHPYLLYNRRWVSWLVFTVLLICYYFCHLNISTELAASELTYQSLDSNH